MCDSSVNEITSFCDYLYHWWCAFLFTISPPTKIQRHRDLKPYMFLEYNHFSITIMIFCGVWGKYEFHSHCLPWFMNLDALWHCMVHLLDCSCIKCPGHHSLFISMPLACVGRDSTLGSITLLQIFQVFSIFILVFLFLSMWQNRVAVNNDGWYVFQFHLLALLWRQPLFHKSAPLARSLFALSGT